MLKIGSSADSLHKGCCLPHQLSEAHSGPLLLFTLVGYGMSGQCNGLIHACRSLNYHFHCVLCISTSFL